MPKKPIQYTYNDHILAQPRPASLWVTDRRVICLDKVTSTNWSAHKVPTLVVYMMGGDYLFVENEEGQDFLEALRSFHLFPRQEDV